MFSGLFRFFGGEKRRVAKLIAAARVGDTGKVKQLLSKGVDINAAEPESGDTAILAAINKGQWATAEYLLTQKPDLNLEDLNGNSPLYLAVSRGDSAVATVKRLLEEGAQVELGPRTGKNAGATPLHISCAAGANLCLEVLLAAGASIAKTLPDGSTPLHTAAIGGDDHAVDLLCTAGASVVALNNAKRTPLHNCGITGNTKVGAALLQKGADVDALDDEGATPLLRAAMGSNADMARLLVQNGANVEHVMGTGTSLRSPLSIAATNGYVDVVRVLIKAGADPKATLGGETTVLALTKQAKQHSAAGILMNALKRKKAAEKQINEPVKQVDAFAPLPKSKPRIDSANVNEDEPTSKMRASVNELGVICPSLRYDEHEHGKKLSKVFSKARAEWVKSKNDPSSPHYTKACKLLTEWFLFEYRVRSGFSISLGFNDDNEIDRVDEVGEVKDASEAVEAAFREPPVLKSFEIIWVDFRSSTSTLPLQDSDSLHQSPEVGAIAVYQIKPKRNLSSPRLLSEFLTGPGQQVAECFAFQIKDALIETVDTNEDGDEYTSSSSTYAGGDIELIVNAYTGKGFRDQLVQAVRDYHKHSSLIGEETPEIKRVMLLGDEGRLRQILDEGLPVETMVEDQTLLKLVLMMAVTAPNWYTHLELSDTLKQSFADENEYREALKRMALELLDRGANIDTTPGPASIMTLAELLEDQTILQICRERTQSGADADALSLLVAAEKGNAASLQALVGRGARVNKRDAFRGITPLMIASQGAGGEDAPPVTGSKMLSQLEAVRYLIDQGARLDAKANNGDTAIGNAVRRGNIEIVKLLLDAGAKTDEALPRNQSLIDLAKERGHVEVLKLLQEHSGKHVGEPSTDGSNDMPLAGRFCLPFDVDAFAEYFPPEWTLVEEMDNETRTLLEGPSGDRIAVGSHQLKPSSDLFDVVGKYAGYFDENEGVEAFTSSIGTQGWSVKVRSGDKSNVMLELWGPALMSVRFVYEATSIDAATKVVLHKAVTNLIWLNGSVSCADALPVKTIKDLQHHIRAVLKDHEGLRDEILSSFADDDNVMLYPHEIEAVAEQGPSTYPLVRALVRYAIVHGIKVDVGDLCKLQSWCGAHFLNDPDLKQLLAGSAQGAAKSTRDFLEIATVARASGDCEREESLIQAALEAAKSTDDHIKLASHPLIATDPARVHSLLDAALAVATDVGDLREVLNHDLAGSDLLRLVLDRLRTSSADETFLSSVWNPLDVLILACDKSLMDRAAVEVEILALADLSPILSDAPKQATVQALPVDDETDEGNRLFQLPDMEEIHGPSGDRMHLLSLAESARDEQWSSLREMLLTRALEAATTAGRKYSAYKFLRETLQDEPRADAYLQANQADLQPFLAKKRDAEQRVQLMDAICQCALLVAAGDGRVTSEVTQELQKVRPIVEMMYRNRHAIEVLEQTEDIDKARSACGSTMLVHSLASMWLFEPAYSREISGVLSEVSTNEGRDNLYRTYATRIEDPLGRRLAVWAATEVASADGFEKGEQRALKIMAAVWGLNIHETHRWFRNFVYPVTNHSFEFIGKNLKDES